MKKKFIIFQLVLVLTLRCFLNVVANDRTCEWGVYGSDSRFSNSVQYEISPGRYLEEKWKSDVLGSGLKSFGIAGTFYICSGNIYAVSDNNDLLCVNGNNGNVIDSYRLSGLNLESMHLSGISGDILFLKYSSNNEWHLTGIDRISMSEKWSKVIPDVEEFFSACNIYNNAAYFTIDWKKMNALDLSNGKMLFSIEPEEEIGIPVFSKNRIIYQFDKKIVCSDISNINERNWEYSQDGTEEITISPNEELCFDVYSSFLDKNANLRCISIDSGKVLWEGSYPFSLFAIPKLIIDDSNLYLATSDMLYCFEPKTGKIKWEYENYHFLSQVVSDNKNLFFINVNGLYILDAATGRELVHLEEYGAQNYTTDIKIAGEKLFIYDSTKGILTCFESAPIEIKYVIDKFGYTANEIEYESDVTPAIINDRTLLSARYVVEPLCGDISWDAKDRRITCVLDDTKVELWVGKSTAKINGIETQIDPNNSDVVPTIINDRTMVPIRFLAESLGCEVEWIAETKEIILTYPNE